MKFGCILVVLLLIVALAGGGLYGYRRHKAQAAKHLATTEELVQNQVADWEAKREEHQAAIADEFGFPWPPPTDRADLQATKERIREQIQAELEKRYPKSMTGQFVRQAEEAFPMAKVGDQVYITVRGGQGQMRPVSGTLHRIEGRYLRIGTERVAFAHIAPHDIHRFDAGINQRKRSEFVQQRIEEFKRARTKLGRSLAQRLLRQAGYAPAPTAPGADDPGEQEIVPVEEFVETVYQERRETARSEIENQVYTDRGYIRQGDKWVREGGLEAWKERLSNPGGDKDEEADGKGEQDAAEPEE